MTLFWKSADLFSDDRLSLNYFIFPFSFPRSTHFNFLKLNMFCPIWNVLQILTDLSVIVQIWSYNISYNDFLRNLHYSSFFSFWFDIQSYYKEEYCTTRHTSLRWLQHKFNGKIRFTIFSHFEPLLPRRSSSENFFQEFSSWKRF